MANSMVIQIEPGKQWVFAALQHDVDPEQLRVIEEKLDQVTQDHKVWGDKVNVGLI